MLRPQVMIGWVGALLVAISSGGCSGPASQDKAKTKGKTESKAPDKANVIGEAAGAGHEGHDHAAGEGKHADASAAAKSDGKSPEVPRDVAKALAQLSESDRAAAEKQRVCPVSGQLLGSMDKPYKVTVKGVTVFLCCKGCESAITKDPDKYLAKLNAKASK